MVVSFFYSLTIKLRHEEQLQNNMLKKRSRTFLQNRFYFFSGVFRNWQNCVLNVSPDFNLEKEGYVYKTMGKKTVKKTWAFKHLIIEQRFQRGIIPLANNPFPKHFFDVIRQFIDWRRIKTAKKLSSYLSKCTSVKCLLDKQDYSIYVRFVFKS